MFTKENAIPPESMAKLTAVLDAYHAQSNPNSAYTFHYNSQSLIKNLREIFKDIPEIYQSLNDNAYIVTRRVTPSASKFAFMAHFDNYRSTILVPIRVPNEEMNGDLIMWRNARFLPKNVLTHLISKLLFQNKLSKMVLKAMYRRGIKFNRYSVKPGGFAKFDGFVDLHFNMPVGSGERFSLLIHNEKMFADTFIVKMIETVSRLMVKQSFPLPQKKHLQIVSSSGMDQHELSGNALKNATKEIETHSKRAG